MSKTRRKRTSSQEQYRLLMECRTSVLSDHQWCKENGIEPSTFYNWVSRLRKKGISDFPEPCHAGEFSPALVQDVVKPDICPEKTFEPSPAYQYQITSTIEISIGDAIVRISNDVDPVLLSQVMRCLSCLFSSIKSLRVYSRLQTTVTVSDTSISSASISIS